MKTEKIELTDEQKSRLVTGKGWLSTPLNDSGVVAMDGEELDIDEFEDDEMNPKYDWKVMLRRVAKGVAVTLVPVLTDAATTGSLSWRSALYLVGGAALGAMVADHDAFQTPPEK